MQPLFKPAKAWKFPHMQALMLAQEQFAIKTSTYHLQLSKTQVFIGWAHSPLRWFKVNTDGSCLGNPGPGGCRCLTRHHSSTWIKRFVPELDKTNTLLAACWGVKDGRELAKSLASKI